MEPVLLVSWNLVSHMNQTSADRIKDRLDSGDKKPCERLSTTPVQSVETARTDVVYDLSLSRGRT